MRSRHVVALLSCLSVFGCEAASNEGAPAPTPVTTGPDASPPAAGSAGPGSVQSSVPPSTVALDGSAPPGASVAIVDAAGRAQQTKASETGAFRFEGVVLPYDLALLDPPVPTAWLGATRVDPKIRSAAPAPAPSTATVTVTLFGDACGDASCTFRVATTSAHGAGSGTASYEAGPSRILAIPVAHTTTGSADPEPIDVDVLFLPSSGAHIAYVHGTVPVGESAITLRPASVPSGGATTVSLDAAGVPDDVSRVTSLSLLFGGKVALDLATEIAPALTFDVPLVPGAQLRASGNTIIFSNYERWRSGDTKVVPIGTNAVTIAAHRDFEVVTPAHDSAVLDTTHHFEWKRTGPTATVVELGKADRSSRARIVTADTSFERARVEALGLVVLPTGVCTMKLAPTPGATVDTALDDAFDPDATTEAYHQIRFTVIE